MRVMMEAMENFMISAVVKICRQEQISGLKKALVQLYFIGFL